MNGWQSTGGRPGAADAGGRTDLTARGFSPADRNARRRATHGRRPGRRWWRWTLGIVVTLVVLIAGAIVAYIKLTPSDPPLTLPAGKASAPSGTLDGAWQVAAGSLAGFRVRETALGLSNDVTGRTSSVTGTIAISGDRVTHANLHIDLATIKVSGKTRPQFAASLGTHDHPVATFTIIQPKMLGPGFASGKTIRSAAAGQLAMNGFSRRVTVAFTARRDGTELQVAGRIPVAFGRWAIRAPGGGGFLGSLAHHGTAEFILFLRHQ